MRRATSLSSYRLRRQSQGALLDAWARAVVLGQDHAWIGRWRHAISTVEDALTRQFAARSASTVDDLGDLDVVNRRIGLDTDALDARGASPLVRAELGRLRSPAAVATMAYLRALRHNGIIAERDDSADLDAPPATDQDLAPLHQEMCRRLSAAQQEVRTRFGNFSVPPSRLPTVPSQQPTLANSPHRMELARMPLRAKRMAIASVAGAAIGILAAIPIHHAASTPPEGGRTSAQRTSVVTTDFVVRPTITTPIEVAAPATAEGIGAITLLTGGAAGAAGGMAISETAVIIRTRRTRSERRTMAWSVADSQRRGRSASDREMGPGAERSMEAATPGTPFLAPAPNGRPPDEQAGEILESPRRPRDPGMTR